MLAHAIFETELGWMGLALSPRGLRFASLPCERVEEVRRELEDLGAVERAAPAAVAPLVELFERACAATPVDFSAVRLDLEGWPPFWQRVWGEVRRIPFGQTLTYGEVAQRAGRPLAARAVGQAMAHNPVALVIPCHRVVAAGGIGGYGGQEALKALLLRREGAEGRAGRRPDPGRPGQR